MLRLIESVPVLDAIGPRSQASSAYVRVKGDILAGRIRPGDKLKINELAAQVGVSPGAIREALSRLVPEGFVISRDQKGFIVAPISIDDLLDLNRLRCDIEEIALRRAVEAGDAAWEASVLSAAHRLRRTARILPNSEPNPDWLQQHEVFHRALVSGCASPRLLALHSHLYEQLERYRLLAWAVDKDRDIDEEHQLLVDAALDRNADGLVRCVRMHFERTAELIVSASRSNTEAVAS